MAKYDVAFDIGHGTDTWEAGGGKGVRHNGRVYEEHTANSDIGARVIKILRAHGLNVYVPQVPMTEEVDLYERIDTANRLGVKLYWSSHFNAGVSSASGVCAFYWNTAPKSHELAKQYVENAKDAGLDTHGDGLHACKYNSWTNLAVCRRTDMVAVLCENGFMTNSGGFKGIFGSNKDNYHQKIAEVEAKTILGFFSKEYDSSKTEDKEYDYYSQNTNSNARKVKEIQKKLVFLGFNLPEYGADGVFGGETDKAVRAFQNKFNLKIDGLVGEATLRKLSQEYQEAKQPKEPAQKVYRVIVDGEQVGAYAKDSNILAQIEEALPHLEENILIEEV